MPTEKSKVISRRKRRQLGMKFLARLFQIAVKDTTPLNCHLSLPSEIPSGCYRSSPLEVDIRYHQDATNFHVPPSPLPRSAHPLVPVFLRRSQRLSQLGRLDRSTDRRNILGCNLGKLKASHTDDLTNHSHRKTETARWRRYSPVYVQGIYYESWCDHGALLVFTPCPLSKLVVPEKLFTMAIIFVNKRHLFAKIEARISRIITLAQPRMREIFRNTQTRAKIRLIGGGGCSGRGKKSLCNTSSISLGSKVSYFRICNTVLYTIAPMQTRVLSLSAIQMENHMV